MKIKLAVIIPAALLFAACSSNSGKLKELQAEVDSLKKQKTQAYKPGLGEFMMGIQVHHAKIWFAGKNQNWQLAEFELNEINELLSDAKAYCTDRPEIKSLPIIDPGLDSVTAAVKTRDIERFKKSFVLLTNACNSCHKNTHHEFNVIKIPDTPPITNQEYGTK